jgi:hypothetical protein
MKKTIKNTRAITSKNTLEFNSFIENQAKFKFPISPLKVSRLADRSNSILSKAEYNIENNILTELCDCFIKYGSDKPTNHNYSQVYFELLRDFRNDDLSFYEIGIGTPNQDVPSAMPLTYVRGASLKGWRDFFNNKLLIKGGDIDPRVLFDDENIATHYINQLNPESIQVYLRKMGAHEAGIDFFLDDGLHEFRSNITLLLNVWPFIKSGGLYLIEDMYEEIYLELFKFLSTLSLGAEITGFELPSIHKADNRILILQKE